MNNLDLLWRIEGGNGTERTYLKRSRFAAWTLLVKIFGLLYVTVALPTHGLTLSEPVLAQDVPVATPSLVVELTDPTQVTLTKPTLSVTVSESRAAERERLERERIAREQTTTVQKTLTTVEPDVPFEVKRALAQAAAAEFGIDWKLVEAVWQIESGKRWKTTVRSSAGAQGPMQFMPGTWRAYQVDGNGDGRADVTDARDAVFAGARYLAANGAATNIDQALLRYNHAGWYVTKVKSIAASIE